MLVRIFKTNQIYIYAFIPLLVIALRWTVFFSEAPFTPSGQLPFFSDFFAWLSLYPWLSILLSAGVISYQAYLISEMMNEHRLLPYSSNLAAFVLVLCYSLLSSHAWFSPIIFSNLFTILAFKRILDIYQQGHIYGNLFRIGLYISLASLLYLPSSFMLLVLFYDLYIIRTFNWREFVIPLLGLITPYLYFLVFYFLRSESEIFLNYFIEPKTFLTLSEWTMLNYLPVIYALIFLLAAAVYLFISGNKRTVRENNLFKVISLMLGVTVILCMIYRRDLMSTTALIWPAASVLFTYYLLGIQRKWVQESLVYLLVVFVLMRDILGALS